MNPAIDRNTGSSSAAPGRSERAENPAVARARGRGPIDPSMLTTTSRVGAGPRGAGLRPGGASSVVQASSWSYLRTAEGFVRVTCASASGRPPISFEVTTELATEIIQKSLEDDRPRDESIRSTAKWLREAHGVAPEEAPLIAKAFYRFDMKACAVVEPRVPTPESTLTAPPPEAVLGSELLGFGFDASAYRIKRRLESDEGHSTPVGAKFDRDKHDLKALSIPPRTQSRMRDAAWNGERARLSDIVDSILFDEDEETRAWTVELFMLDAREERERRSAAQGT